MIRNRVATGSQFRCAAGFSLLELLVALAVFSVMSAIAYGGLNSITRTRGELARQEDEFRDLSRAVAALERDLREATARPVRGNFGLAVAAFIGASDHLELTRLGFANPRAETRSNLERVVYSLDAGALKRARYPVLDRAPTTAPVVLDLKVKAEEFRLRYLDASNRWLDAWPPPQTSAPDPTLLPRAVRWVLRTHNDGEIQGTVELVSAWPPTASATPSAASTPPGVKPLPGTLQ